MCNDTNYNTIICMYPSSTNNNNSGNGSGNNVLPGGNLVITGEWCDGALADYGIISSTMYIIYIYKYLLCNHVHFIYMIYVILYILLYIQ